MCVSVYVASFECVRVYVFMFYAVFVLCFSNVWICVCVCFEMRVLMCVF